MRTKVLVITAGPGVGKTTLVNSILKVVGARVCRSSSARPSAPLADGEHRAGGRTILGLLDADPTNGGFKRGEEHPLECDLPVVDEAIMVDVPPIRALLKALPNAGDAT